MPNHCWNSLTVFGAREDVDKFVGKVNLAFAEFGSSDVSVDGGGFTFAAFVPPAPNVLRGVSGSASFVRRDGVWEDTLLGADEAALEGLEFYRGAYGTDANGNVFTQPEMVERGLVDWYSWNLDNWGTKWDAYDVQVERQDDTVLWIGFNTAWSPPVPVIHAMQGQHPELSITAEYEEEGMGFRGEVFADGTIFHDDDWEPEYEEEEEVV